MRAAPRLACLIAVLASASACGAAEWPPYGHKDFVPTPERPIGYRGDGSGHFPGAEGVTGLERMTALHAASAVAATFDMDVELAAEGPDFGGPLANGAAWRLPARWASSRAFSS